MLSNSDHMSAELLRREPDKNGELVRLLRETAPREPTQRTPVMSDDIVPDLTSPDVEPEPPVFRGGSHRRHCTEGGVGATTAYESPLPPMNVRRVPDAAYERPYLVGDALAAWDSVEAFARFVVEAAGLRLEISESQPLAIGKARVEVAVDLDERGFYVVFFRKGGRLLPPPAPRSLALAEVYFLAVTGKLPVRSAKGKADAALARYKRRALMDAGLVDRPPVALRPLAAEAPASAHVTWGVIAHLLSVHRLTEPPGTELPLSAPWLVDYARDPGGRPWPGVTEGALVAGKRWLRKHGQIVEAGRVPSGKGRPLILWQVAEVAA